MGKNYKHPITIFLSLFLMLFGLTTVTYGDGDTRPATQAEKDFYRLVIQTIAKALPPGPSGWEILSKTEFKELEYVGVSDPALNPITGPEYNPFKINYNVFWRDQQRKTAAEKEIQEALNKQFSQQQANPNKAVSDEFTKEFEKLAQELEKAFNAGDLNKAQQIQGQMEKAGAKMNGISEENDDERNKLIAKMSPHDVDACIRVEVNYTYEDGFYTPVKQEPPIAGCLVFRTEGEYTPERGWQEGYTHVFLGKDWRPRLNGVYLILEAAVNKTLPVTTAQTIEVVVQGDPARTETILRQINWEALKGLIQN